MADENKNPEVELDTDGVNEERVDIPEAKEPDESFAQKEDVDLGPPPKIKKIQYASANLALRTKIK